MKRKIYGVSYNNYNEIDGIVFFETKEDAENWLHTEQYRFSTRELMTKTAAIKLVGKKAVETAADYNIEKAYNDYFYGHRDAATENIE